MAISYTETILSI